MLNNMTKEELQVPGWEHLSDAVIHEYQAIDPLEKCPLPLAKLTFEIKNIFQFYRIVNYVKSADKPQVDTTIKLFVRESVFSKIACLRNLEVRISPFGDQGLEMFQRFHYNEEPFPDFSTTITSNY
jgi:hypothetical protein